MTHIRVSALEISFFLNKYVWNEQTSQKKKIIIRFGLSGKQACRGKVECLTEFFWNFFFVYPSKAINHKTFLKFVSAKLSEPNFEVNRMLYRLISIDLV